MFYDYISSSVSAGSVLLRRLACYILPLPWVWRKTAWALGPACMFRLFACRCVREGESSQGFLCGKMDLGLDELHFDS